LLQDDKNVDIKFNVQQCVSGITFISTLKIKRLERKMI
jgi:hypothetical protein